MTSVDARGKHLFLRFEGDLTLHSHLRMTGAWGTYARGRPGGAIPRRAWLVISAASTTSSSSTGPSSS